MAWIGAAAPLYLKFMQTLTPHFHWIAANLRCSLWLFAKCTNLWLNCVFDTAEDYRPLHALPKFLEDCGECPRTHGFPISTCLPPPCPGRWGTWMMPSSIQVWGRLATSPSPRNYGTRVVPEFYRDGLREESCEDGDSVVRGASRWVSQQVERLATTLRGAGVYQVPPRGLPRGILDKARAKSSQESSRKVGGTAPSPLFCLTRLRIRETFSEHLGIANG